MSRNPYRLLSPAEGELSIPDFAGEHPRDGFSTRVLEHLMEPWPKRSRNAPWLYWDSELYSQGMLLRALAGWPDWLPIPVNADHGAVSMMNFPPREQHAPSGVHLTYSAVKYALAPPLEQCEIYLAPSPWVAWMEAAGAKVRPDARGTLAYLPHSLPGDTLSEDYVDEYLDWLSGLGPDHSPVVISLHPHDVRDGLHHELIERGLRVVTAGDSIHPSFFLRWVAIAQHFRFATSATAGSQALLFHSMGGTYFLGGPFPRFNGTTLAEDETYRSRTSFQARLQDEVSRLEQGLFSRPERAASQAEYLQLFISSGKREDFRAIRRLFFRCLTRAPHSYWLRWGHHYARLFAKSVRSWIRHLVGGRGGVA